MVSIVSAYYLIKSKFPSEVYKKWIKNFLKIKTSKIIFTNLESKNAIIECYSPDDCIDNITYVILNIDDFLCSKRWSKEEWEYHHSIDFEKSYHTIDLYKIWAEKTNFLKIATELNPYKSNYFVWCDIGCFRNEHTINNYLWWPNVEKMNEERIFFLEIEPFTQSEIESVTHSISDVFQTKNRIGGGIFGGTSKNISKLHKLVYDMYDEFFINKVFAGKDQSIYAYTILRNRSFFDIIKINYVVKPFNYDIVKWFFLEDYFNAPLISVIIPLFNGVEFLKEAIDSVLNQTYDRYLILIGINGHPINGEVYKNVCEIVNDNPKIKVFQYEKACATTTQNNLVKNMDINSSKICVLDADDKWAPSKLEEQLKYTNYDVVGTMCQYFGMNNGYPNIPYGEIKVTAKVNPIINSSCMITKSSFIKVGCLSEGEFRIIYDYELWLRMNSLGFRFFNVNKVLTYHRIHNSYFNGSTKQSMQLQLLKEKYK